MAENKKRILIIDDDDNVCQMIAEKFGQLGYQVLIAYEGAEGLTKTEQSRPDCVLLDIRIPKGMDGFTYLQKMRSFRHNDPQEQARIRKTPVIVLTGVGAAMKNIFEAEGISGFIEKPFALSHLHSKIEQVLGSRRNL